MGKIVALVYHIPQYFTISKQFKLVLADFLCSYAKVFKSKIFVAVVAGRIFDSLSYKGYLTYQPKYLENYYGIPLYKANQYVGKKLYSFL